MMLTVNIVCLSMERYEEYDVDREPGIPWWEMVIPWWGNEQSDLLKSFFKWPYRDQL